MSATSWAWIRQIPSRSGMSVSSPSGPGGIERAPENAAAFMAAMLPSLRARACGSVAAASDEEGTYAMIRCRMSGIEEGGAGRLRSSAIRTHCRRSRPGVQTGVTEASAMTIGPCMGSLMAVVLAAALQEADGTEFFESKIRPVLAEQCLKCHGEKKAKGGLRLDTRAGWEKGGDSGPALVRRKPSASLLLKMIRGDETAPPPMPP